MKIFLIANHDAGFADHVELADNTTLGELFDKQCPGGKPSDFLIRVNRQPASRDQVLRQGDRVSFTPKKIEGA